MPPGQLRGCGRGVFALSSWQTPLRRPQCLQEVKVEKNDWRPGQKLMMKYKYEANPDSPLGKELTVKQKENVLFVSRFDEHWIIVSTENGREQGYVPDNYVMASPDTVKSLPWLDNKSAEDQVQQAPAEFKPYKSAYAPKRDSTNTAQTEEDNSQYYCKVCEKQLNGPIPFKAHVASKAHKEEVEVQREYQAA